MDIAAVPHAQGQGDGGLAVAPARGGGFAVVWSVEQDPGLLQTAHVAADGTLTEPAGLGPGIAVTSYPVMSLVKMPAGYLLFVCDTPDPRHSGPTRLVVVPLDRKLRAQGGWRQILVGLRTDDWPLTAAALDVKTAAVTYQAAGGALSTLVVDAHGEIASTPTEDTVAVPAPDGGGSVMAVPAAPPNVRTGGKDSGRFPPPLGGMAGEGPGVRTLWSMEAKALRRDSGGERQHWVGGPTAGDPGWLAATDLREPQILVSSSGAWVLGYAFGEQGEGGGNAADVVLVRVPSS